jgi:hypothetical protein
MNYQEYTDSIETLKATYGDKAYPDPRVKRIWEWAKKTNADLFKQAVNNAIADCPTAPLFGKLKEFYAEARSKNPSAEKVNCDFCEGTGWIAHCEADQGVPTAYACKCEAGQGVPDIYARWNGPWVRITTRAHEILKTNTNQLIQKTMKGLGDA